LARLKWYVSHIFSRGFFRVFIGSSRKKWGLNRFGRQCAKKDELLAIDCAWTGGVFDLGPGLDLDGPPLCTKVGGITVANCIYFGVLFV